MKAVNYLILLISIAGLSIIDKISAADFQAAKDKFNITMKDGTVFVGVIQIKTVTFKTGYGGSDVNLADLVSFGDGFLMLSDGSKLRGGFKSDNIVIVTARGEMTLPGDSIVSISRSSAPIPATNTGAAVASPPTSSPIPPTNTVAAATSPRNSDAKPNALKMGNEYDRAGDFFSPPGGGLAFNKIIYKFSRRGVSVFYVLGPSGYIHRAEDGNLFITARESPPWVVASSQVELGPGSAVPILNDAPFSVQGMSIDVDWSKKETHSQYFDVTQCSPGSEVWNLKNDGLIMKSATSPGNIFTLNAAAGMMTDSSATTNTETINR